MSFGFGPTRRRRSSLFVGAWFQILDPPQGPAVCDPAKGIGSDGKFRFAGNFDPAAPVSAKPLFSRGEDGIFNQNAVFEMASNKNTCNLYRIKGSLIWQSGFFRTASE